MSRGLVRPAAEGGQRRKKNLSGSQRQKLAARRRAAEAGESSGAAGTQKGEGRTGGKSRTVDPVLQSTPAAAPEQVLLPPLLPCLRKDEPHAPHYVRIQMHILPAGDLLTTINEQAMGTPTSSSISRRCCLHQAAEGSGQMCVSVELPW